MRRKSKRSFWQYLKISISNRKVMIKIEPNLKLNSKNAVSSAGSNKQMKEEDIDFSKMSELGIFYNKIHQLI